MRCHPQARIRVKQSFLQEVADHADRLRADHVERRCRRALIRLALEQQVTDLRAVPERQYELVLAGERCERRSRNRQIAALDLRRDGLAASRERIAPSAARMRTSGCLTSARDRRRTHTSGGGHAVTLSRSMLSAPLSAATTGGTMSTGRWEC